MESNCRQNQLRGIKYSGLVEPYRQAEEPQPLSVIFILENITSYSVARRALNEKYGPCSFDSMRNRYRDTKKGDAKMVIIEANFTDSMKRRQALKETLLQKGCSRLMVAGKGINMKVVPIIPIAATVLIYKLKNLPCKSVVEACMLVSNAVMQRFNKLCLGRGWNPQTVQDRVIDIVPGYERKAGCFMQDGTNMMEVFTGTVYVILQVDSDLGKTPHIKANGIKIYPTSKTTHYIYCKRCKMVDSHDIEDCPLPTPSSSNHP